MDKGDIFCKLVHMATKKGIVVRFDPLRANRARIKGDRIAIKQDLSTIDDFNYELAHELAHAYLHYDKGNILPGEVDEKLYEEYEQQADRAAQMILDALVQE